MKYREYGKTGKKISTIGFGGMRFSEDEDEGIEALIKASENGINYFDTAPGYCKDRSEVIFGKAFKHFKSPFYVSTKSSIQAQPKADDIRGRIDEALQRMGLEKIHFFHMWCIMNWDHFEKVIAPDGPYEGALKAQKEGLVDHIVFSAHANGDEIRRICETQMFEGVTLGYNIFNHSNRYDGIISAYKNNMGVVVMNPLGGGMVPAAAEKLQFIQRNKDESVVQAALRFVISHPEITSALAGMGTAAQVLENSAVGDRLEAPDPDLVDAVKEKYSALGESFCTACKYCLPCPEGIDIPAILSALNRYRVGMENESRGFYNFFRKMAKDSWREPSLCTECGACVTRCTQKLEIPELLKQASDLFEKTE